MRLRHAANICCSSSSRNLSSLWQVKKQLSVHRDCRLLLTLPGLHQQFYIMGDKVIATPTSSSALKHRLCHPCSEVMHQGIPLRSSHSSCLKSFTFLNSCGSSGPFASHMTTSPLPSFYLPSPTFLGFLGSLGSIL